MHDGDPHPKKPSGPGPKKPALLPLLGSTLHGKDWAAAMMGPESVSRAQELLAAQWQQFPQLKRTLHGHQLLPAQYVLRYYVYDQASAPVPEKLVQAFSHTMEDRELTLVDGKPVMRKVAVMRPNNPLIPVNSNIRRAIHDAVSAIESQTGGRLKFVEVTDPKSAELDFGAVPCSDGFSGITSTNSHHIVLVDHYFNYSYSSYMPHVLLHEIGHSLGLRHVQHNATQLPSFYDSNMVYWNVNDKARYALNEDEMGYPVGLMPSDLLALERLYPTMLDALGRVVGPVPGFPANGEIDAVLRRDGMAVPLRFPTDGLAMQPVQDTRHDRLEIQGPAHFAFFTQHYKKSVTGGNQVPGAVNIVQVPNGIAVTQPYQTSTSFLPVHAETISLPEGLPAQVSLIGDAELQLPRAREQRLFPAAPDQQVSISGKGNHVRMPSANLISGTQQLLLSSGSETELQIGRVENASIMQKNWQRPILVVDGRTLGGGAHHLRAHWSRAYDGAYQLRIETALPHRAIAPIMVTLRGALPQSFNEGTLQSFMEQGVSLLKADGSLTPIALEQAPISHGIDFLFPRSIAPVKRTR